MLNFAVGPVMSEDYLLKISGEQVPYFRTKEFSEIVFESENHLKDLALAPDGAPLSLLRVWDQHRWKLR